MTDTCTTCRYLGHTCCRFDGHPTDPELTCEHYYEYSWPPIWLVIAFGVPDSAHYLEPSAIARLEELQRKYRPAEWDQLMKSNTFQIVKVPVKGLRL